MATFFIAGVMQGSRSGKGIYNQNYRQQIKKLLEQYLPESKIICPFEENPNSIDYDFETGKQVFLSLVQTATAVDVVIAYLPEASMGTAVEIWEAYKHGVTIWTISPLGKNWVIKFLSQQVFASITQWETWLKEGKEAGLDLIRRPK